MKRINLVESHRQDWKYFMQIDDTKRHWINQRILEDERDLEDIPVPQPKPYIQETTKKLSIKQAIMYSYAVFASYRP